MQTFIADLIPRLARVSQKLDNIALIVDQHWVVVDEVNRTKNVWIFRRNNELLISSDGQVEKAKWEFVGQNSLLVDRSTGSLLFRHGFLDDAVMALKGRKPKRPPRMIPIPPSKKSSSPRSADRKPSRTCRSRFRHFRVKPSKHGR